MQGCQQMLCAPAAPSTAEPEIVLACRVGWVAWASWSSQDRQLWQGQVPAGIVCAAPAWQAVQPLAASLAAGDCWWCVLDGSMDRQTDTRLSIDGCCQLLLQLVVQVWVVLCQLLLDGPATRADQHKKRAGFNAGSLLLFGPSMQSPSALWSQPLAPAYTHLMQAYAASRSWRSCSSCCTATCPAATCCSSSTLAAVLKSRSSLRAVFSWRRLHAWCGKSW